MTKLETVFYWLAAPALAMALPFYPKSYVNFLDDMTDVMLFFSGIILWVIFSILLSF